MGSSAQWPPAGREAGAEEKASLHVLPNHCRTACTGPGDQERNARQYSAHARPRGVLLAHQAASFQPTVGKSDQGYCWGQQPQVGCRQRQAGKGHEGGDEGQEERARGASCVQQTLRDVPQQQAAWGGRLGRGQPRSCYAG